MKKNRKARSRVTGYASPEEVDVPELSDEEFSRAVPFKKAFPEAHASWKRRRGRPRSAAPKKQLTIRLNASIVDHVKSIDRYTAKVEKILQKAIERGAL